MSDMKKQLLRVGSGLGLISVLVSIAIIVLLVTILNKFSYLCQFLFPDYKQVQKLDLSGFGDYFSGVWGTIVAFIGVILAAVGSVYVYKTYKNQKKSEYLQMVIDIIYRQIDLIIAELINYGSSKNLAKVYSELADFSIIEVASLSEKHTNLELHSIILRDANQREYLENWHFRAFIFDNFSLFTTLIEKDHDLLDEFDRKACYNIICTNLKMEVIIKYLKKCREILEKVGLQASEYAVDEELALYNRNISLMKVIVDNTQITSKRSIGKISTF